MPEFIHARDIAAGTLLFAEGDPGDDAYIIESGLIEIAIGTGDTRKLIASLGPGEIVGEMALIANAPRSASALATVNTRLLVVRRGRLMKPIENADPVMRLMIQIIVERLSDASRWMSGTESSVPEAIQQARREAFGEVRDIALGRLRIERELRRAIETPQFELHYQPIVSMHDRSIAGYEALMRWNDPVKGQISPGNFIVLAEETGMIVEMGRWALKKALSDHAAMVRIWQRCWPGKKIPFVSINISSGQLIEPGEVARLSAIIVDSGVEPDQIKLEVTESLMIHDPESATSALLDLKALGVAFAIDDFGTGYSSLSYLHRFPIDTLKVDQSFVFNMLNDTTSGRLVRTILHMADDLGLETVAEGIETEAHFEKLCAFGCTYGQGFLMARPWPRFDLEAMLENGITW
ncbi:MAG: EAL domain-containing protein [Minwuia sp.]|nr:EAL domain-containing protein [Minwuia sp.]